MKNEYLIFILVVLCTIVIVLISCILYLKLSRSKKIIFKKAIEEAKTIKMNAVADAKAQTALIFLESENNLKLHKLDIQSSINELNTRRKTFFNEIEKFNKKEIEILSKESSVLRLENELNMKIKELVKELEIVSSLSKEEAKKTLLKNIEIQNRIEIADFLKKSEEENLKTAKQRAQEILIEAMQKNTIDIVNERSVAFVKVDSDDFKGRVIGKEGRNIRAFEQYGGVDIIIDDTPNTFMVSSFNPIRREIAVRSLKFLIKDGRIQPAKIEETLMIEEKKLNEEIFEVGKKTLFEMGINDLPNELISLVGKLAYRTSYGQNALQHSKEVGLLCQSIASELGLDPLLAKKAGFLHDIGKAVDFEQEGTHVQVGVKLLKKYDIDNIILNAVEAHHDDVVKQSVYAELVVIADKMSAGRPGARNNSFENFFIKMEEIENTVKSFKGVQNVFALQSGRQIRVIVDPDIIDDQQMAQLNKDISKMLRERISIAGEIIVTLIREKRSILKV